MQRAIKVQIVVGKDHVVKLPSDFPEGPAEIIALVPGQERSDTSDVVGAARRAALGRFQTLGFKLPDDFNAPLRPEVQGYFDGEDDAKHSLLEAARTTPGSP